MSPGRAVGLVCRRASEEIRSTWVWSLRSRIILETFRRTKLEVHLVIIGQDDSDVALDACLKIQPEIKSPPFILCRKRRFTTSCSPLNVRENHWAPKLVL